MTRKKLRPRDQLERCSDMDVAARDGRDERPCIPTSKSRCRKFLFVAIAVVLASCAPCGTYAMTDLTCLKDDLTSPKFYAVGGYKNNTYQDLQACFAQCYKYGCSVIGIEQAQFCFCANNKTATANAEIAALGGLSTAGTCNVSCAGGATCGGAVGAGVSAWLQDPTPQSAISISTPSLIFVKINTAVSVSVNSSGPFYTDWGDGAISLLGFTQYTFTMAGRFTITARLHDNDAVAAPSKQVVVVDAPKTLLLDCPKLLQVAVPASCNVTSWQGYNFTFSTAIKSPFQNQTFVGSLPDAELDLYGSTVHPENATSKTSKTYNGQDIVLLRNGLVRRSGILARVIVGAPLGFSIEIIKLTPVCVTGTYCGGACRTACTGTCSASCPNIPACSPACSVQSSITSYTPVTLVTLSGATTNDFDLSGQLYSVTEGTYLGFRTSSTTGIYTTVVSGNDTVKAHLKDTLLSSAGAILNLTLAYNHDVRIMIQAHPTVSLLPPIICIAPAPVNASNVPQPYTAATEQYIYNTSFLISLQFYTYHASKATYLNTYHASKATPLYTYHANANTTTFNWTVPLTYALEGAYNITGYAKNFLGNVTFSTIVHVVPEVTDTWVVTVSCPCYNIDPYFTVNLTFPSAAHPPWNLTITIAYTANTTASTALSDVFVAPRVEDFGTYDGKGPGGASGAAKELKLGYLLQPAQAGNYSLLVNLSNEVSAAHFPVQIQVLEGIRNVTGVVTWVLDGIERAGNGPAGNIFVSNLTTLVTPSTLTGTPEKWRLYILPTKEEKIVDYVPGYKFNITYPGVGPVTFTVSAYNSKQGWVVAPSLNVTYVDSIAGFSLSDDGVLGSVNVSKPVISTFEILTPVSCLIINWGDNSTEEAFGDKLTCSRRYPEIPFKGYISSNQILQHTYTKEGIFTVRGLAYDLSNNVLTSQLDVVVADIPCKMPNVSVVDAVKQVYNAPSQIKSLPIRVMSNTIIECNKTVTVKRYWTIEMVNSTTGTTLSIKPIEGLLSSWNYTTLVVDALFLDIGYYKFTFTVDVQASKVIALIRSDYTYYQVIRSNLSASILAGGITSMSRAYTQNLDLKPGTESVDPDEPSAPFTDVKWYCRQILPTAEKLQVDAQNFPLDVNTQPIPAPKAAVGRTGGGCFGVGPGMLSYTGAVMTLQLSSFYLPEATYEFTAVVLKDVRRAKATLELKVVAQPPPEVAIRCAVPSLCLAQSDGRLVNPALRLTLAGSCFDSGTDGMTVSLSPSLYALNPLSEKFTVRLTIITSDNRIGYSQIVIKKNKPPTGGTCSVTSVNGYYCLLSQFTVSCDKWQDPEAIGISAYNFYYLEYKLDGKILKAAMASTSQNRLSAVFPYGNFSVYVEVSDSFGANTEYFIGNVTTIMPTKDMVTAYNTTAVLTALSTAGDSVQISMFIKALNSLVANANWSDISDSAFFQKNITEQEAMLTELSDSKSQQLQSLKNSAPPSSIAEVNVFSDVLDSSVSLILGSQAGPMTVGMDAREDCLSTLEKISGALPGIPVGSAYEYEPFVKSALGVMTALMKGMNGILEAEELLPPKDRQAAAKGALDYDGAIPDDPNMEIPDNLGDIYKQSIMESTSRQSISPDSDAPCESQIYFMASGAYDETEVRFMPKANSNLYRRYDRNTFVMTTARPLGPLHYLRVFLDNRGRLPYDSWQLERVVFRDLQKFEQYTFETNAWLALNRGEGLIDRTFLCANNNEDTSTFSQRMYVNTNRNANQDHIWMSVFLRPIGSRYCRKERIVVCTTFLFVSMLLNAMFYQIEGESPIDGYAYIGPVPIALSQMFKGFMVIIFVFPFTALLGVIFKRARPRKYVRCKALDAIEKQRKTQFMTAGLSEEDASENSKVPEKHDEEPKPKMKPVVKCLPWWTRLLGWIICAVVMAGSLFLVWSYGITWGEITTVKWFSSFFTTFLVSILVSQWIKVAFVSCFGSLCCAPDHSVDDIDCDEELPQLKEDEKWAFMSPLDPSIVRDVHRVIGVTHDVEKTKNLRVKLTKERDMKFIVRGVLVYCIFLAVLLIIVTDKTNYNAFLMQKHFSDTFIKLKDNYLAYGRPNQLRNTDQFWLWAKLAVMNITRAQRWYNGATPYGLRGFMDDRANRMVGYPILRQIRNSRFVCSVPYPMNDTLPECTGDRGVLLEDYQDYCANWVLFNHSDPSCNYPEFKYQTSRQLKSFTSVGRLGTYGAGGYVIRLNGNQEDVIARLDQLQKVHWIDKRSRAVIFEFSVYNANVNLFMTGTIYFEINEGGGIVTKWRFEPVRLLRLESSASDKFLTLCELTFVVSTVFFTIRQLWELKKQKCGYFLMYWNIAEISIVLFSWVEIALYIYKLLLTLDVSHEFNQTKGNAYLRMDYPVLIDQYYTYILGLIMFLSILKLIKLLQFNKRMDVLALTIALCWDELSYFFIAFTVIFFAFCCLFYLIFYLFLPQFSTVISAVQTSFSMMLGKFDFAEMQQANSLSPLLFFIFSVLNSMVLVNIMLAIILKAFNEIKIDLSKRENPYDVMDYMWDNFKKYLVLQPNEINQVEVNLNKRERVAVQSESDRDLPDKVGQLLQHINSVYFDGRLDLSDSQALKEALHADAQKKRAPIFQHDGKPRTIFFSD
ncbi:hypothetical protein HAZT_HAZT008286 [Hyalella azteca]|uniref:Uncharacterized protein n=1 Tax=Hyalella azteca TaxID=294128 RepID=A0A6A0HEK1_HYAAZ|nr:hypothetical protein HAZT_HAZT008286 [Hyalella azteca]